MTVASDEEEIDLIISQFFEQFDNRNGRIPSLKVLDSLFVPGAIIVQSVGARCERYSVREFAEPRIRLLTSGELTHFHEWETGATTHFLGRIASRISTYSKRGLLRAQPYDGKGIKLFQLGCFQEGWRISAIAWSDVLSTEKRLKP